MKSYVLFCSSSSNDGESLVGNMQSRISTEVAGQVCVPRYSLGRFRNVRFYVYPYVYNAALAGREAVHSTTHHYIWTHRFP